MKEGFEIFCNLSQGKLMFTNSAFSRWLRLKVRCRPTLNCMYWYIPFRITRRKNYSLLNLISVRFIPVTRVWLQHIRLLHVYSAAQQSYDTRFHLVQEINLTGRKGRTVKFCQNSLFSRCLSQSLSFNCNSIASVCSKVMIDIHMIILWQPC